MVAEAAGCFELQRDVQRYLVRVARLSLFRSPILANWADGPTAVEVVSCVPVTIVLPTGSCAA